MIYIFFCTDEVPSVDGAFLKVPDIVNSKVKLCVSFGSSTSTEGTLVLAHPANDFKRLSAYFLNTSNCTAPLDAGYYTVGVFTKSSESTLKEPVASPIFSFYTETISEYSLF